MFLLMVHTWIGIASVPVKVHDKSNDADDQQDEDGKDDEDPPRSRCCDWNIHGMESPN